MYKRQAWRAARWAQRRIILALIFWYPSSSKSRGEDDISTLTSALNYASTLIDLERFKEAKSLLRKTIPVAQRVSGERVLLTLTMKVYAEVLCCDVGATLDTLREAVTTLEEIERTARQVLGGAHPTTEGIEATLRRARVILQAREARSA